ncbi:MAG: 4Fe-4S binding protein [Phycisphaerales bacterium]
MQHTPTVAAAPAGPAPASPARFTISAGAPLIAATELRQICLDAGAHDAGFVEIDRPALAHQRDDIRTVLPRTRTLIALVMRMSPESVRSPLRAVANTEFHAVGEETNHVARRIVDALVRRGIRAVNPGMAFPMEVSRVPERVPWIVSHKLVAEQAGLGRMGIHRNVIHPRFGNFILLSTVFCEAVVDAYGVPLDDNPCISCKLCVAACPVGAISPEGRFNVASCSTHNYREFLGGFTDWVETITESAGRLGYRRRVEDHETLSMWQSLAYGPNYKAAYCLAVCPAGTDVLGPFVRDKAEHVESVVRPLQQKVEPLYVVKGSDAETFARARYPHKRLRHVHTGIKPTSVASFLWGVPWLLQPGQAGDLAATFHFRFTGAETRDATIDIRDRRATVREGLHGRADATVVADARAWVRFLRRELALPWALLTRRIRIGGGLRAIRLMGAFGRCFPS